MCIYVYILYWVYSGVLCMAIQQHYRFSIGKKKKVPSSNQLHKMKIPVAYNVGPPFKG